MSDSDIADELPATGLAAIAAFRHGPGFVLSLLGDDGELHTYTLTGQKLRQVATVVAQCVQGIPSGSVSELKIFE